MSSGTGWRWRPGAAVIAAGLALAAAAPAAGQSMLPGDKDLERWVELRSSNFTFYSNASQRTTRRVAADLEALRAALIQLSGGGRPGPVPTYVFVFRNQRTYEPYKHLYLGRPATVSGSFQSRSEGDYIAIDGSSRDQATEIVNHEYVHKLVADRGVRLPLWFEEGLSELYRTFTVTGGEAHIGRVIPGHLQLMRGRSRLSMPELFAVDRNAPAYNQPARKGMFYAQSWALVHYLLLGNEARREQINGCLAAVDRGVPHEEAFAELLYADHEALSRELARYLSRTGLPYARQPVQVTRVSDLEPRAMAAADVLYHLGDLLAGQEPPRPEAEAHFRAALEADPEHGLSLAGLGRLAEERARWDEARALYERAASAAPDAPLVLFRFGELLLERHHEHARARAMLARASALAPDFAPAWFALARAWVATGEVGEEAVRAAETALALMPDRQDVAGTLLRIYLLAERRQAAELLVERTPAFGARERARAWSSLLAHDLDRAGRMVSEGRTGEGLELVEQVESRLDRAASRQRLGSRVAEIRAAIEQARLVERYKQAVARFEAGDPDGAAALLDEVLAGADEGGGLAAAARHLELEIRHPGAAASAWSTSTAIPLVSQFETEQLNRMLADGRHDEALLLLEDLKQRIGHGGPFWIDAKMDEIRRAQAHNRFVEQYNRAVDLFNAGDHGGAVQVLEALLESELDEEQAEDVRQLLEEARRAAGGGEPGDW